MNLLLLDYRMSTLLNYCHFLMPQAELLLVILLLVRQKLNYVHLSWHDWLLNYLKRNCVAFRTVVQKLYRLPQQLVAARLVKPLLSRFVVLDDDACEHLIPHLLTPITGWPHFFFTVKFKPLLTISWKLLINVLVFQMLNYRFVKNSTIVINILITFERLGFTLNYGI